jgi:hypothetical protein
MLLSVVRRLARVLVSLLAAIVVMASELATSRVDHVILEHVTIIDGTGAPPRPDQTVVIAGDRIAARLEVSGKSASSGRSRLGVSRTSWFCVRIQPSTSAARGRSRW